MGWFKKAKREKKIRPSEPAPPAPPPPAEPGSERALTGQAAGFARLLQWSIPVTTVIDVGASNGCWSECFMNIYPNARYFCIEAQRNHEEGLKAFVAKHPNAEYIITAAGDSEGDIHFFVSPTNPFGGAAFRNADGPNKVRSSMTTVDLLCKRNALQPPYLIKLDTHGFEGPILDGASETLKETNLLVIEAYNFRFRKDMMLFSELCLRLERQGFHCLDLIAPLYRPLDGVLWQIDVIFGRETLPMFASKRFQAPPAESTANASAPQRIQP